MSKEINTQKLIQNAVEQITAPWRDGAGFMPSLSTLEVARVAELPNNDSSSVVSTIFKGTIIVNAGWSDCPLQAQLADEDEYVFPILRSGKLNEGILDARFNTYIRNLRARLRTRYPILNLNIFRWSEIKALADMNQIPESCLDTQDQQSEVERMMEIFAPGNYYNGVLSPTPEQLADIVSLKFRTYARQGYVLTRAFPNAILLQNELPPLLRTRMINAANTERDLISVIYPYTRENSPY